MTGCDSVEWRTVTDILKFEDRFRENLADILKEVKKRYRFGEFEIDEVTTSWVVQGRNPDINLHRKLYILFTFIIHI